MDDSTVLIKLAVRFPADLADGAVEQAVEAVVPRMERMLRDSLGREDVVAMPPRISMQLLHGQDL